MCCILHAFTNVGQVVKNLFPETISLSIAVQVVGGQRRSTARMIERAVRCSGLIKRRGGRCKCLGGSEGIRTGETCRHDESRWINLHVVEQACEDPGLFNL